MKQGTIIVVVRFVIDTQNRLVLLHPALFLGSRRDGHHPTKCNLSTRWIDKAVFKKTDLPLGDLSRFYPCYVNDSVPIPGERVEPKKKGREY